MWIVSRDGFTCLEYSGLLMETGVLSLLGDFWVITVHVIYSL